LFAKRISQKTLSEWVAIFDKYDACVTPVLELSDLTGHPHHLARKIKSDLTSPMPAPRFGTQLNISDDVLLPGQNSVAISKEVIGLDKNEIMGLLQSKILIQSKL
jgi:alpha-methylacyl-CoA racemase